MCPFICNKKIVLSNNELTILAKDPKFNLLIEPTELGYQTEVERGLSKHRFNENMKKKKEDQSKLSHVLGAAVLEGPSGGIIHDRAQRLEQERIDEIYTIFKEFEGRYVYNPISRKINFNSRRALNYELNKSITLPKSLDGEAEFSCEMKRRELLESFREYEKERASLGNLNTNKHKKTGSDNIIKKEGENLNIKTSKYNKRDFISNLSKEERKGLSSLKKRIKNN